MSDSSDLIHRVERLESKLDETHQIVSPLVGAYLKLESALPRILEKLERLEANDSASASKLDVVGTKLDQSIHEGQLREQKTQARFDAQDVRLQQIEKDSKQHVTDLKAQLVEQELSEKKETAKQKTQIITAFAVCFVGAILAYFLRK